VITHWLFWTFLALGVPAFWLLPARHRLGFLAALSFTYLLYLAPGGTVALAAWTIGYFLLVPRLVRSSARGRFMPVLVLAPLAYLAYFKYLPELIDAVSPEPVLAGFAVPLGISYFTFKLIHYAVEVSRGRLRAHDFAEFACYMFLVPIYSAGPIERFDHFLGNREQDWRLQSTAEGLTRIAHGLIKKFVIANLVLLPLYGNVGDGGALLERLSELPSWKVWGFCVITFLYTYLDFSAYSDIAIGASRLFGLRIMENFDWPILAQNISIFWRRWHMTLAGWCQNYVYMPSIGLTRNPYLATYVTFGAIGLWHSASFGWLAWGIYHATGISVYGLWSRERRRRKWRGLDHPAGRWVGIFLTMAFVSGGSALTAIDGHGGPWDTLRVLCKLAMIDLAV
jgi:alginate O-acetyltransferase complex protein AlgI